MCKQEHHSIMTQNTSEQLKHQELDVLRQMSFRLLGSSLSLNIGRKLIILHLLDTLSAAKLADLITEFNEENQKFTELEQENMEDVIALRHKRGEEWEAVIKSGLDLIEQYHRKQTTLH